MSWLEFMEWMAEKCEQCGCLLNNSPACEDECAHPDGCPAVTG